MKDRRKEDPEAVRRNWERSRYGVSKEDLGEQLCKICGSTERLCIDHDHNTGAVRGLLCTKCNTAIGMFNDRPELLLRAVKYLDGPHFELP